MSGKRFFGAAVCLTVGISVTGCAVGPNFEPPPAPDVNRYTKEPLAARTSSADVADGEAQRFLKGRDLSGEWWRMFKSPALDALIKQALDANPNVQSALAALRVSKETVYAQEGKFFPFVQANFTPTQNQTSSAITPVPSNNATVYSLYTSQVLVSYTLDIWGLNRRTVESLQAQADFQRFQVEGAYLTLTSNVAVAAIQEASLRAQIDATNEIIDANSKMLDILRRQLETGYANRSDVAVQEAQLAQVRSTLPPLRKALQQNRDLISALAGRFPSQEPKETFRLVALHLPVDLPVSLPSQVVEQRPDIRSAEEQLHSASALVGVAIANMLPNVTLSADAGYQALQLANLISPASEFFTLAGSVTQPIFDGLTLFHQERAAEAAYDEAVWNYRSTVITAFQNVADTLRALQNDADELKAAHDFERAAKISLDLAQQQMQTGNANVLLLLTAQATYQQAVIAVVQAQAARLSDTAALYQALGGGWWNRIDIPPSSPIGPATTAPTVASSPTTAPTLASSNMPTDCLASINLERCER